MNYLKTIGIAALAWTLAPAATAETVSPTTGDGIIQLSELAGTEYITCLSGENVRLNKSTANNPLTIEGTVYESGIGTHAPSVIIVELNGATSFHAIIGVDDEAQTLDNHGIFTYTVTAYGDNIDATTEICTGELDRHNDTYHYVVDINDLSGYKYLKLDFATGTKAWADHVDVADARFTYEGTVPAIVPESDMYLDKTRIVELPTEATIEGAQILPLSALDGIGNIVNGWRTPQTDKSIEANPIMMKGYRYVSGLGLHATASIVIKLNGSAPKFHASLGIDDEVTSSINNRPAVSNVNYSVILRRQGGVQEERMSGTINVSDAEVVNIDLDGLTEYRYLIIELSDANGNECDHVDLGNAYFEFLYQNSNAPVFVSPSELHSGLDAATTLFSQPGVRFMHKLRTISPEATIEVGELPAGLTYNERRHLIEGVIDVEGVYNYSIKTTLGEEEETTPVTLTVSSNLQQPTPFMGWLSWNSIEGNISEDKVKMAADALVNQGLMEAGYNYLVIDDLWHADARAANGDPVEHPTKFPSGMKASADYVHSKGLKFGIYSDAANKTCAGAYGSLGYETEDANQYAKWDVDLLKYDYCGAPADVNTAKTRYKAMGDALKASGRDILFYICEWGPREPWKWGAEAGGTCWRATYDTRDCWIGKNGGIGIVQTISVMKDIWAYNGVNRWNDADMMMIGLNGTGKSSNALCQTGPGMTKDEYRTQMALWCMWASPLTLSNDLTKAMSEEDLKIATNAELIAINQDRMGQAAETIFHDANDCLMLAKDCENGDVVVSVTNLTAAAKAFTLDLSQVSAADPEAEYFCRDVVKHEDAPKVKGTVDFGTVPSHATAVYRLSLKDPQLGINDVVASKALDNVTVATADSAVTVCMPGTEGTPKRLLLSDLEGRVIANASGVAECFTLAAPAKGVYVVNVVCAARSISKKIVL